jgi:hypothetical protein
VPILVQLPSDCVLEDHRLRNLDESLPILAFDIVFRREDLGFNDREDTVVDIVVVDFVGDDFLADFMASGSYVFVDDG